jgi:hypothetical protein
MNAVFILGLGLAAIDGLTSAFVAMLVLALVVIGSGASDAPPDISETAVLIVQKPAIRLLASIAADSAAPSLLVPREGFQDERVPELEIYTRSGRVEWLNCDTCSARLQINRPSNVLWRVCLVRANTPMGFTEAPIVSMDLTLSLVSGGVETKLPPDKWDNKSEWHAYEFNATNKTFQKGDAKKCFAR